jgi:hypothetical protein
MTESFTHETTFSPRDKKGEEVGEIELRITYRVNSWGCPARVHFDENDHPAEAPEVDVIHVEMLNAPKSGREAVWIDVWDWLYEWAGEWCDRHAASLVGKARLEINDARDAYDEDRWRDRQLEARGR